MQASTLNALEIVAVIRSKIKPPASVPTIPQTIVIPPNIVSASFWKQLSSHECRGKILLSRLYRHWKLCTCKDTTRRWRDEDKQIVAKYVLLPLSHWIANIFQIMWGGIWKILTIQWDGGSIIQLFGLIILS